MSRFSRAFDIVVRGAGSAGKDPRQTARSLGLLPSVWQGAHFSREFHPPPRIEADEGENSESTNPLLSHFNAHTEGPGIWKWVHYFDIYHRHFHRFVGRDVHVMEVGIYSGGSLPMWRQYFGAGCRVYGVDIEEACRAYEDESTKVFIGDQADAAFWGSVRQAVPKLDILIDDGGHQFEQQRVTLEEMLPHLRPGGVYVCEDIHGAGNPFAGYIQGLANSLNAVEPAEVPSGTGGFASATSSFQMAIRGIHVYPFLAVIEKRERDLHRFVAPKHGSHWQPFL